MSYTPMVGTGDDTIPREPPGMQEKPVTDHPKVFVGQLGLNADEAAVRALFSQYGSLRSCDLGKQHGQPKGFAMVVFDKWAAAEAAIECEHGNTTFNPEKQLVVKFADPPRPVDGGPVKGLAPKKLFVGQVSPNTTEADLRDMFAPFGTLVDIYILNKGKNTSCAFVKFSRWAEAEAAIEALNNSQTMDGAKAPLVVKFADMKVKEGTTAGSGTKRGLDNSGGYAGAAKRQNAGMGMGGMGGMTNAGMNDPATMMNMMMNNPMMGMYNPMMAASMGMFNPMMAFGMGDMSGMGMGMGATGTNTGAAMGMGGTGTSMGMGGTGGGMAGMAGAGAGMGAMGGSGAGMGMMPGMGAGMMQGMGAGMGAGMGGMGAGAMAGMGGMTMGKVDASKGVTTSAKMPANAPKLFIGQLPFQTTEADIIALLSQVGAVHNCHVLKKSNGQSRGCAFALMGDRATADAAIRRLNGAVGVLPGSMEARPLVVKYADEK